MGGKNFPICYLSKIWHRMPSRRKKITYFKFILPNTRNEVKETIWASRTSEQFLLHVHTAMHLCQQIGLDTNKANVTMTLEAAYCELEVTESEYATLAKTKKTKQRNKRKRVRTWIQTSMLTHLP